MSHVGQLKGKVKLGHKNSLWRVTKANLTLHIGDLDFDTSRARFELCIDIA